MGDSAGPSLPAPAPEPVPAAQQVGATTWQERDEFSGMALELPSLPPTLLDASVPVGRAARRLQKLAPTSASFGRQLFTDATFGGAPRPRPDMSEELQEDAVGFERPRSRGATHSHCWTYRAFIPIASRGRWAEVVDLGR